MNDPAVWDAVVIGAGYAGLSAASALHSAGRRVVLLEARDRVGGRTLDRALPGGTRLELGGQYIAPVQERVTKLVADLGLKTYLAWGTGDNFIADGGQVARTRSAPAKSLVEQLGRPAAVGAEIEAGLNELARLFPTVPAATPWLGPDAEARDATTFQSWIDARLQSRPGREFFRFLTNQAFSTEPGQISLLQMLWFLRTSHGLPSWAIGGPQANRVDGGTQLVAERMADRLAESLRLRQSVRGIEQNDAGVRVRTAGDEVRAKAVVVCLPPQLVPALEYSPVLPPDLHRAFAAMQTGNAMKVQAVYERPFWRDHGWSGNGLAFDGPQTFTYDNTPSAGSPGVLLGFLTARRATDQNRLSAADRRAAVLATWEKVFGPGALEPIDYIEQDWAAEAWTRGGHGCHFPPGAWCELGPALGGEKMPRFGRIWWAASDLAKDWNGYLEGAILAGRQAAAEVAELLG